MPRQVKRLAKEFLVHLLIQNGIEFPVKSLMSWKDIRFIGADMAGLPKEETGALSFQTEMPCTLNGMGFAGRNRADMRRS
jgi:hypothetical protein